MNTKESFLKRYSLRKITGTILVVGVLIGTYNIFAQQFDYSSSLEVQPIRIGNIGEYSIFNLIAQEKGYFREQGLEAQIQEFASGPPAITALKEGKVDVAVAADFVGVVNILTAPDLKILAQLSEHRVFNVVARKDKGITTIADLKGKTIGVTKKSAGEFFMTRFLNFNGIRMNEVKAIDLSPNDMIAQLKEGALDAAVIFEPHVFTLRKELGTNAITWSAQGDQNIFALLYSTDTVIKNHPDTITRYLHALVEAEKYAKQHPQETKNSIRDILNYTPEYTEYSWQNFDHTIALDQDLLLTMEHQARWVMNEMLNKKIATPNYLDSIYFDALERTKPSAISIIR